MVTTVRDNSPQSINTSLFSLQKEIDGLKDRIEGVNAKKGDKGAQGERGYRGEKGEQGDKGDKGDKGDPLEIEIAGSQEELTDDSGFIEMDVGNTAYGKRHPLAKLWDWIVGKISRTKRWVWTSSGTGVMATIMHTDENGFTFENPLTGEDRDNPDKPLKVIKRNGSPGTMQVGPIQVDGASNKNSYNECLRLNRYNGDSWASIALGGKSGSTDGTDNNTWLIGASPSPGLNPNELVINRNGSNDEGCSSFFKDNQNRTCLRTGAIVSQSYGFSPLAKTFRATTGQEKGWIQVRFPNAWIANMMSFNIRVTQYADFRLYEGMFYGYAYTDGKWYNTYLVDGAHNAELVFKAGAGADGCATVLFRWVNDTYISSFPQIDIYNFSCGYVGTGWDPSQIEISVTTSPNWDNVAYPLD